jgi:hypothetical protein
MFYIMADALAVVKGRSSAAIGGHAAWASLLSEFIAAGMSPRTALLS